LNQINRKLNFLRNCHQADGQAQTLWDAFSSKVSLRHSVSIDAWNTEGLLEVDEEYQDLLAKTLDRYSRESSLILCHTFITCFHQVTNFGQKSKGQLISCPVFYYPAEFSDEGIRIDQQTQLDSVYFSSKKMLKSLSQKGLIEPTKQNDLSRGLSLLNFDSDSQEIDKLFYVDSEEGLVRPVRRKFIKGQASITDTGRNWC